MYKELTEKIDAFADQEHIRAEIRSGTQYTMDEAIRYALSGIQKLSTSV
jgi:hypothetical protein